jgi:cell volume regulation protein A
VYVRELRLPVGAQVSLVVRNEEAFTPNGQTRLREHDQLLVVTTAEVRERTEERLRAVDRGGALVRWRESDPGPRPEGGGAPA